MNKFKYLKKDEGKLASDYHENTNHSINRKRKVIMEQINRESNWYQNEITRLQNENKKLTMEIGIKRST